MFWLACGDVDGFIGGEIRNGFGFVAKDALILMEELKHDAANADSDCRGDQDFDEREPAGPQKPCPTSTVARASSW